jgi:hypothetical protein
MIKPRRALRTVFGSNKANLKSEEEPKQLPGLETSTLHFLNAKDSDAGIKHASGEEG